MSNHFESRTSSPPNKYYNSELHYKMSSNRTLKKGVDRENFSELSQNQSNQSYKMNRHSYDKFLQPEEKVIKELNFLEKEIISVRGNNDRIMNEINEIKNLISDRLKNTQWSNDTTKNEMQLMEEELEGLINEEKKLDNREQESQENYNFQLEKLKQEESANEMYNDAHFLLRKELEELERELELLKNSELSESTVQESFSALLEQINLIKQRFIKGYAVIIMDKLYNNLSKSLVRDSFGIMCTKDDPRLKELLVLKLFKKHSDGQRQHFNKLSGLVSTKKVEDTISLKKFFMKYNQINNARISLESLRDQEQTKMLLNNQSALRIDKLSHILKRYMIKVVLNKLINRLYLSNEKLEKEIMVKSQNSQGVDVDESDYNKAMVSYIDKSKFFYGKKNLISFHICKIENKKEDAEQKIKAYKIWQSIRATTKLSKSMIPLNTMISYKKYLTKKLGIIDIILYKSKFYALEKYLNKLRNFNLSREKEHLKGSIAYNTDKFDELDKIYTGKRSGESFITKIENTFGYQVLLNKRKSFYSILNYAVKHDSKYSDQKTLSKYYLKNFEEFFQRRVMFGFRKIYYESEDKKNNGINNSILDATNQTKTLTRRLDGIKDEKEHLLAYEEQCKNSVIFKFFVKQIQLKKMNALYRLINNGKIFNVVKKYVRKLGQSYVYENQYLSMIKLRKNVTIKQRNENLIKTIMKIETKHSNSRHARYSQFKIEKSSIAAQRNKSEIFTCISKLTIKNVRYSFYMIFMYWQETNFSKLRLDIEEVVNERKSIFRQNKTNMVKAEDYNYQRKYDIEKIALKKAKFFVSQMQRNFLSCSFYKLLMLKSGGRKDYFVPFSNKIQMFMDYKLRNNLHNAWKTVYDFVLNQKLEELDQNTCEMVKETRALKSELDEEFESFSNAYSLFKIRNQIFKNKKHRYKIIWNKVIKRNREKLDLKKRAQCFEIQAQASINKNNLIEEIKLINLRKCFTGQRNWAFVHKKLRLFCIKNQVILDKSNEKFVKKSFNTILDYAITKDHNDKEAKFYEYESLLENTNKNLKRAQNLMNYLVENRKVNDFINYYFLAWKNHTKNMRRKKLLVNAQKKLYDKRYLRKVFIGLNAYKNYSIDSKRILINYLVKSSKNTKVLFLNKFKKEFLKQEVHPKMVFLCNKILNASKHKANEYLHLAKDNKNQVDEVETSCRLNKLRDIFYRFDLITIGISLNKIKESKYIMADEYSKDVQASEFYERSQRKKFFHILSLYTKLRQIDDSFSPNENLIYQNLIKRMAANKLSQKPEYENKKNNPIKCIAENLENEQHRLDKDKKYMLKSSITINDLPLIKYPYKRLAFNSLKRHVEQKKKFILSAIGGREAFMKLREFNQNLKRELDFNTDPYNQKVQHTEKDYFNDYLELKRLQREGRNFLKNSKLSQEKRSKKRKYDLINMLEKSVNTIVTVQEEIKAKRVSNCFTELKRRPIGINLWEKTLSLKIISRNVDKLDKKLVYLEEVNEELLCSIEMQKSQPNYIQKYLEEKRLLENEIESQSFELNKLQGENIHLSKQLTCAKDEQRNMISILKSMI